MRRGTRPNQRPFQKRILDKVAVYASLPNPLEFAEPLAGYDMNRFQVGDYRVAFQIDQNIISLADIRDKQRQPALRRQ
jgi:mRNA-degrading endonuclease RelE of RelBE toxin-antitoxin system